MQDIERKGRDDGEEGDLRSACHGVGPRVTCYGESALYEDAGYGDVEHGVVCCLQPFYLDLWSYLRVDSPSVLEGEDPYKDKGHVVQYVPQYTEE